MGLAIGISFFVLLALLIYHELTYDTIHPYYERIYRVIEIVKNKGTDGEHSSSVPFSLGEQLSHSFPTYIDACVRIFNGQVPFHVISYQGKVYNEPNFYFVDTTFFQVFNFPLAQGNKQTALKKNSILISDRIAKKYFKDENPLGKSISLENQISLTITGVFAPKRHTSHFDFDFIASFNIIKALFPPYMIESRIWNPCWTYILLNETTHPEDIEYEFPNFIDSYFPDLLKKKVHLYLQPLREIHLNSELDYEMESNGDIRYIYIFAGIAFLIIVTAVINSTTLSMAQSSVRMREMAIRKAMGASKHELWKQLCIESALIIALIILTSFIIIEQVFPFLEDFSGNKLQPTYIDQKLFILSTIGIGLLIGSISRIYPSYALSFFESSQVFHPSFSLKEKNKKFRIFLVIIQFVITTFLLTSIFVSRKQIQFLSAKQLGFEKKDIVIIPLSSLETRRYSSLIQKNLLNDSSIQSVALMQEVLGVSHQTYGFFLNSLDSVVFLPTFFIDKEFIDVYQLRLLAGNYFDETELYNQVLINECMANYMGYKNIEDAVGKKISTIRHESKTIVGIIANFNFESLHKTIDPVVLIGYKNLQSHYLRGKYLAVRIKEQNTDSAISSIQHIWKIFYPNRPLTYFFLDKAIDKQYFKEHRLMKISVYFSLVAVIIACLCLFGLSFFVMERRKREIAIRKAMGISNFSLLWEMSKNFLVTATIGILISFPISYLLMQDWLNLFSYKIQMSIWNFVFSALIGLMITVIAISYHMIHALLKNPVEDLQIA